MTQGRPEATAALWRSLVAALAAAGLGDLYLLWGRSSATAFALPALLVPLAAAASLAWIVAAAVRALQPIDRRAPWLAGGAGVIVVAVAVLDLVPPVARDELTHHLAIPALYVRARRIIEVPFADQSYYPMLVEMFYTPLLRWLPDNLPKYLHLLYGAGSAGCLMLYVRRSEGPAASALAGLLVLGTPVVFALAASAYVDLGLLFYATGALVALLVWSEDLERRWLVLAALLAGCAAATKYNGLLVLALLGAGTVLLPEAQHRSRERLRFAAVFGLVALLPVAPWLIQNWADTGNPIFPLFNGLIGGRPLPPRSGIDILTQRRQLYGESWLDIALIPLRIFITGREGDAARFDGVFNPLLLLGLGAAFGRGAARRERFLGLYALMYALLAFFLISLRVRYSIVIVAPLVLLTVTALVRLRRAGGTGATLAGAALAGAMMFSAEHFVLLWRQRDPLPYLSGRIDRDGYIRRFWPEYDTLLFAKRELPPSARLYLLFLGNRSYYCGNDYVYETYFSGVGLLRRAVDAGSSGAGIAAALRRAGVSHLLTADELVRRYLRDTLNDAELARWDDFARHHLRQLYTHNGFGLYEIKES